MHTCLHKAPATPWRIELNDDPKGSQYISHGALKGTEWKILSGYTTDCLTCPNGGVQSPNEGLNIGEVFKGKMNRFIFSFKTSSHKMVNNRMPHYIPRCALPAIALAWGRQAGLRAWATLSYAEGEPRSVWDRHAKVQDTAFLLRSGAAASRRAGGSWTPQCSEMINMRYTLSYFSACCFPVPSPSTPHRNWKESML